MEETEIQLSAMPSEAKFISLVETLAASYGLHIKMFSTLSTYPGSLHWHLVKPKTKGTLELTLWPAGKRAWFSVQVNTLDSQAFQTGIQCLQ
jgi:hypothetical protein